MGGPGSGRRAGLQAGRSPPGPGAAERDAGKAGAGRGPPGAGRVRRSDRLCVPAARTRERTAHDARRGRHRHRQDPGVPRPRQPLGRGQRAGGLGFHLYPRPAAADRTREPCSVPRSQGSRPQGGGPQGARELPVPAEFPGAGTGRADGRRRPDRPWAGVALDPRRPRRRHDRRRLPRLAAHAVCGRSHRPGQRGQSGRPPGRVRPCRLRPLPRLLHRKDHPRFAPRRPGDRQPRPGALRGRLRRRPGRARHEPRQRVHQLQAHRVRRGPPSVRRGRLRLFGGAVRRRSGRVAALDPRSGRARPARARVGSASLRVGGRPRRGPTGADRRRPRGGRSARRGLVGPHRPSVRRSQPDGPDRRLPHRRPRAGAGALLGLRARPGMRRAACARHGARRGPRCGAGPVDRRGAAGGAGKGAEPAA